MDIEELKNKMVGCYENGNYTVMIGEDGTKVRFTEANEFIPTRLESCDCKITNFCDMGCAFCFAEGTEVDTKEDKIKIEEIKHGTEVYSYNINSNLIEYNEVINTFKRHYKGKIIKIYIGNHVILCTPEHHIYTQNRGYVEAKDLQYDDEVLFLNVRENM